MGNYLHDRDRQTPGPHHRRDVWHGLELAKLAAADGYALLLAADRPFERALAELSGAAAETTRIDLSTAEGVAALVAQVGGR